MNYQKILTGFGVLVLVVLGGWYWMNANPAPAPASANDTIEIQTPKTNTLSYENGVLTPNMIVLNEGDRTIFNVTSDERGEFHISGYEIENFMGTPGQALEFSFVANILGRYNLEWHPGNTAEEAAAAEDLVVGVLVVNPR